MTPWASVRRFACAIALASPLASQCGAAWAAPASASFGGAVQVLSAWDPDGLGPLAPRSVAAGDFTSVGSLGAARIAVYDDALQVWVPLGTGLGSRVRCVLGLDSGVLVAGGDFLDVAGMPAPGVARWDGTQWRALGSGLAFGASPGRAHALGRLPDGSLVAGGFFSTAGGVPAANVARWDGAAWQSLGSGTNGGINCILSDAEGRLWFGGSFTQAGSQPASRVARWDGTAWSPMTGGPSASVLDMAWDADGRLLVCTSQHVMRWDGIAWATLPQVPGQPYTSRLVVLPDGSVLVAGFGSIGGVFADHLFRWDGATWTLVATANGAVNELRAEEDGSVVVAGGFTAVAGIAAQRLAVLASTCPAASSSVAAGCSGIASALRVESAAWLGGAVRTSVIGLPGGALPVVVRGLEPTQLALAAVLGGALPGCELRVRADTLTLASVASGSASARLDVPHVPALTGMVVHEQWVVLEPTSGGAPRATSTNSLAHAVGAF